MKMNWLKPSVPFMLFANVWMHNGFVTIDNEKMSKSLGNFFTLRRYLTTMHQMRFDFSLQEPITGPH